MVGTSSIRRSSLSLGLVACAAWVGCRDDPPEQACSAKARALEAAIASTPSEEPLRVPGDIELPERAGNAPPPDGSVLALDARGAASIDGRAFDQPAAAASHLAGVASRWRLLHPRRPYPAVLYVAADRVVSAASLRRATSEVREHHLHLVVRDGDAEARRLGCPSSLGAVCGEIASAPTPAARELVLSRVWGGSSGACPAVAAFERRLTGAAVRTRRTLLRRELPPLLEACRCAGVDAAGLTYLAYGLAGGLEPALRTVALPAPSETADPETVGAWAPLLR